LILHDDNATHYGATIVEVLMDLRVVFVNYKVESGIKEILDQTIDVCKVFKRPRGLTQSMLQSYKKFMDLGLFKCPIKKGKYFAVKAREKDFLENLELEGNFPNFIPLKGNYTFRYQVWTIVQKKKVNLIAGFDRFEFV
jgi:Protein of unknown function (DUF1091)